MTAGGATLAGVFRLGAQLSAQVLGLSMAQYRPTATTAAIVSGNQLGTILATVYGEPNPKPGKAIKPLDADKPRAYGNFDPTVTQPGDYLVGPIVYGGPSLTFFVASQDPPMAFVVIRCNVVLNFTRSTSVVEGGDSATVLCTGWPAALHLGGGRQGSDTLHLPGLDKLSGFQALLPPSLPFQPIAGDEFVTAADPTSRYLIQGAVVDEQGWTVHAALRAA